MNKTIINKDNNEELMIEESISVPKIEKVRIDYEQWIQSAPVDQVPNRKRLVQSDIDQLSEASEDEIIVLEEPLVHEFDCQILNEMEILYQLNGDIDKLKIEYSKSKMKLNLLQELKLSVVSKKFKLSPTTITYPFAFVEIKRQLNNLLKKMIPDLKDVPITQLKIAQNTQSLDIFPEIKKTLDKCNILKEFGLAFIDEILRDKQKFARTIQEIIRDENLCYMISNSNPENYNSCYIMYATLLDSLNKSSAC